MEFTQEYKIGLSSKISVRIILHSNRIKYKALWLCCCSVAKLCLTLQPHELQHARLPCPGEFAQTHAHWVCDGFPRGSNEEQSACNAGDGFNPWVGKLPWGREQLPTPWVLLPGESHGPRSLVGCSAWGCKESDTTEWLTLSLHYVNS